MIILDKIYEMVLVSFIQI